MGNRRISLRKHIVLTLLSLLWSVQWCRSRTARRRSSTAGRAAPQGCGLSCGPSSSTPPTSRRCAAHLHTHTHTRSQGCTAVEADTVCYEADAAAAFPKTACLLPDVTLAALFTSSPNRRHQLTPAAPEFEPLGALQLAALLSTWSNAFKCLAIQRVILNCAAACGAPCKMPESRLSGLSRQRW